MRLATLARRMADGNRPTLSVAERSERGTRATKRLRREGLVPGVVYGGSDGGSHSFKVGTRELRHFQSTVVWVKIEILGRGHDDCAR